MKSSKMYESPQAAANGIATPMKGGAAPSKADVVRSANARAQTRHEMKGQRYADEKVLPSSGGESLEKSGIEDTGYLVKKGLKFGVNAFYNTLPPGMDIEDQELADIREMPTKDLVDHTGFDGWD